MGRYTVTLTASDRCGQVYTATTGIAVRPEVPAADALPAWAEEFGTNLERAHAVTDVLEGTLEEAERLSSGMFVSLRAMDEASPALVAGRFVELGDEGERLEESLSESLELLVEELFPLLARWHDRLELAGSVLNQSLSDAIGSGEGLRAALESVLETVAEWRRAVALAEQRARESSGENGGSTLVWQVDGITRDLRRAVDRYRILKGDVPPSPGDASQDGLPSFADSFCGGQVVTIMGTDGDDEITGTEFPDVIHGRDGRDTIYGAGGADVICGGWGDDKLLDGGGSGDTIYGWAGNDALVGDTHSGSDDFLDGGPGDDILIGGVGNDELYGGPGTDMLYGDLSFQSLGTQFADIMDGGDGDDELVGGGGPDTIHGGPGQDSIYGFFNAPPFTPALAAADTDYLIWRPWGRQHRWRSGRRLGSWRRRKGLAFGWS